MTKNHDADGAAPHSIEAEQAVLGALLRFNDAFDQLGDLEAKHFYREDHRIIFGEMRRMISHGEPADPVTVWATLEGHGGAIGVDIGAYLNQLAQNAPSSAGIDRHASIVVDRALRRATMAIADRISGLAMNPKGKSADEVLDAMQSMVTSLAERRVRNEPQMIGTILAGFIDGMTKRAEGLESAIPTGIPGLDRLLTGGGFRPGQLIIVAGRPSMGKTALACDIGLNVAEAPTGPGSQESYSVLDFSMEMEGQELAGRALASRGRVSLTKILGAIREDDEAAWSGVSAGCIKLDRLKFGIDDTPAISLLELRMKAKAWKRKHGLHLIVVDYLGLMSGGDGEKRHEQIGSYSRGLKALAKELGVAVIALAQLNRKVEDRPDRRPVLSDLRDSGEIEQDADIVILVHRPEMYDPENPDLRGYAEALIRKQRSGSLGDVPLRYDGPTCSFTDWTGPAPTQQVGPRRGKADKFD
jgi:replicative DNA helicase